MEEEITWARVQKSNTATHLLSLVRINQQEGRGNNWSQRLIHDI